MNDLFTFSIDWGRALFDSAIWIARAWAIAAVCTLVVLVLIARYTTWGRQFWRITGAYFTGPHSVKVWLWLAALLLSVIVGVRLNVLFSYQSNDMMSAAQAAFTGIGAGDEAVKASGKHGFYTSLGIFSILAIVHVARVMLDLFMMQRFMLAWRVWVTDRLTIQLPPASLDATTRLISDYAAQWGFPADAVTHWHASAAQRASGDLNYGTQVFTPPEIGPVHLEFQVSHHVPERAFVIAALFSWHARAH